MYLLVWLGRRAYKVHEDSRRKYDGTSKKSMKGFISIKTVNELFWNAVTYHNYRLSETSNIQYSKNISKSERLQVQIKSNMFESSDPISILSFIHLFKSKCDSIDLKKGTAMCFVP